MCFDFRMQANGNIRYVPHDKIDRRKWNRCIDEAGGYPFYAYDFYLDAMSRHWDALVQNDYETIIPLTWNKKWGIHYLYQPFLTPHLGVIGKEMNKETVQDFLLAVPQKFRFWEINLNRTNDFVIDQFTLKRKQNYFLPLQQPYAVIRSRYRENHRRNIKKAERLCTYKVGISLQDALQPAEQQLKQYTTLKKDDLPRFARLCRQLLKEKKAQTFGVYGNGRLLSSAVFFYGRERFYYILAGNHPEGKSNGASHFLLDNFIRERAEQNAVLDFVGSDIRSVAFFYEGFGAEKSHYTSVKLNRLPKPIRWLKE